MISQSHKHSMNLTKSSKILRHAGEESHTGNPFFHVGTEIHMTCRPVRSAIRELTALTFKSIMHHGWEERNHGFQVINPEVVCKALQVCPDKNNLIMIEKTLSLYLMLTYSPAGVIPIT